MPNVAIWTLGLFTMNRSVTKVGPTEKPFKPMYWYSTFVVQLGAKAHSMPAPASQPPWEFAVIARGGKGAIVNLASTLGAGL